MTIHDRFLELAASGIDFELSADEQTALHRHLEGCDSCRPRIARMRNDATAIAALPLLRPGWSVPALDLGRRARRSSGASLRLVAVAALSLAIAAGVIAIGAELIHRQQLLVPTVTSGPSPSVGPSAAAPSSGPVAGRWRVENVDVGDLPFGIAAVARSGSRLVAVGSRTCVPVSAPTDCWANVFTSDDGGRSWAAAPRSDALVVAFGGIGSGPQPGMLDVAAGHGAFMAIGYDDQFRAATWKSIDGMVWTKSPADATSDQARVRSVVATAAGWVVGGEVFLDSGPRAAIWMSPDGVTWTRAADGPAFDIGGYMDTGEEPGAGGIADVIARGSMTIAVGRTCDDRGFACVPAAWTSDGGPWTRSSPGGGTSNGMLRAVAPFGQDLIAAGLRCGSGFDSSSFFGCAAGERLAVALRSPDGVGWTESGIPVTSGTLGIRALGATDDYLVGVVEGVEGAEGVDSRPSPELILVASIDGKTWERVGGVPDLGLTDIREVGVAATADGSIVIVGWGQEPSSDAGFKSFVVLVRRTPG